MHEPVMSRAVLLTFENSFQVSCPCTCGGDCVHVYDVYASQLMNYRNPPVLERQP